jgi:hypothetical protein
LSPQQAALPSARSPQVWKAPAETSVKVPADGVACPSPLYPQQDALPSMLSPQVWVPPAETWVKVTVDGVDALA